MVHTESETESYINPVKVDAYEKAKAILADQKANSDQTIGEYEEYARDGCQTEVAQSEAAVSAIQLEDEQLSKEVSSVANLKSHLSHAQQVANEETEQNTTSQARLGTL